MVRPLQKPSDRFRDSRAKTQARVAARMTGRYNHRMSSKLAKTNPYLRDPAVRERTVLKSVASSSAIEGIRAPFKKTAAKAKSASVPAKNKR